MNAQTVTFSAAPNVLVSEQNKPNERRASVNGPTSSSRRRAPAASREAPAIPPKASCCWFARCTAKPSNPSAAIVEIDDHAAAYSGPNMKSIYSIDGSGFGMEGQYVLIPSCVGQQYVRHDEKG